MDPREFFLSSSSKERFFILLLQPPLIEQKSRQKTILSSSIVTINQKEVEIKTDSVTIIPFTDDERHDQPAAEEEDDGE